MNDTRLNANYDIPNGALRAAVYVRKSNRSEGRSKSTTEQYDYCLEALEDLAFSSQNISLYSEDDGWKGEYYWQDKEGRNPSPWRPELTRLVDDIQAGRIDVVIVWRSDRLYRDPNVCNDLMSIFRTHKIRFICGRWEMDIESAEGIYTTTVDAAANRKVRDRASEDIKRDHLWKAKRGMITGNPSCLGFRSKGRGTRDVSPVPEELDIVNRIFRLFVTGENGRGPMTSNGIATLMMTEGVQVIRGIRGQAIRYKNYVTARRIGVILRNCMYAGRWRYAGEEYDCEKLLVPAADGSGRLESAVPIGIYNAAQDKLQSGQRPGKRSLGDTHLLTGIAVCAYCGCPLYIRTCQANSNGKRYRDPSNRFGCRRKQPKGNCVPFGMPMLRETVLDQWVLEELAPVLAAQINHIQSSVGRHTDLQILAELERKAIEIKEQETRKLISVMQVLDQEQIARIAAEFRKERECLERRAKELRFRLERSEMIMPKLTPEALSTLPRASLKDALRRALEWIAVGKDGIIVLTKWGTYIAADYNNLRAGAAFTKGVYMGINTPMPDTTLKCLEWLPSTESFVQGRRLFLETNRHNLSDEEILPGAFSDPKQDYIPEVELVETSL